MFHQMFFWLYLLFEQSHSNFNFIFVVISRMKPGPNGLRFYEEQSRMARTYSLENSESHTQASIEGPSA